MATRSCIPTMSSGRTEQLNNEPDRQAKQCNNTLDHQKSRGVTTIDQISRPNKSIFSVKKINMENSNFIGRLESRRNSHSQATATLFQQFWRPSLRIDFCGPFPKPLIEGREPWSPGRADHFKLVNWLGIVIRVTRLLKSIC